MLKPRTPSPLPLAKGPDRDAVDRLPPARRPPAAQTLAQYCVAFNAAFPAVRPGGLPRDWHTTLQYYAITIFVLKQIFTLQVAECRKFAKYFITDSTP